MKKELCGGYVKEFDEDDYYRGRWEEQDPSEFMYQREVM